MLCDVESGNITKLLAILTEQNETDIEKMLMNGINPAQVADYYGKLDEFNAFFKTNIISKLRVLVNNKEITPDYAYEFFKQTVNG